MDRGLAADIEAALALIGTGRVLVGGAPASNAARLVAPDEPVRIFGGGERYASRGGIKLEAALAHFALDVAGKRVIDLGTSTGGFCDCLLRSGASCVVAVDVAFGTLHEALRSDPRVILMERTNARYLTPAAVAGAGGGCDPFPLVTADLSFISLTTVAPVLAGEIAADGADLVVLVKPQFEAPRREVDKAGGIVRDPAVWSSVLEKVEGALLSQGAVMMGAMVSPIRGAKGNVEFFVHASAHGAKDDEPTEGSRWCDTLRAGVVADAVSLFLEGP